MTMSDVTPEARSAIEARFPEATVQKVEGKLGNTYEITLQQGEAVADVKLHQDGTIIEVETVIDASDLPKPVADTVAQKAQDCELTKVEKVEELAKQTLGGVEKLAEPELYYEVKWIAGGLERELEVNADGSVR
jgi:hypothetical protein